MHRFDEYELERELGRGATAKIYLARHCETRELVSIKIFHPQMFHDPLFSRRIQRELQVSAGLDHRQIVRVKKVLDQTDPPALVLDYIEGENLEKFQAQLPYILPEISALIVIKLLEALEYAHSKGLLHRDIKPENVLIRKDGNVFLTDFGLAKTVHQTVTQVSNALLGSIDYMAPEQARGDTLTQVSDLFAVASILYFLVTGTRPFARSTPLATLAAIREVQFEPCQRRNPKISGALARIIERGMEKEPSGRYQSASEFKQALLLYLRGLGLDGHSFNLHTWVETPTAVTTEALEICAEKLAERCAQSLKDKRWNAFLEDFSHLGLKAPDSAALNRLMGEFRKAKSARRRVRLLSILIIAVIAIGFCAVAVRSRLRSWLHGKAEPSPSFQKVEQGVSPHEVFRKPESPPSAPPIQPKLATVLFHVPRGVSLLWDGKQIDPLLPLNGQLPGEHSILIRRAGFAPIRAKVNVKLGEPTVININ